MYSYSYYESYGIWTGISFILAIIGGIAVYFTFSSSKNEGKFEGTLGWLYDFLSFKKLIIEGILRVLYLISACFITLLGIITLFYSFLKGILIIFLGNVILRIAYETFMIFIVICKNIIDINKKLGSAKKKKSNLNNVQATASEKSVVKEETPKKAEEKVVETNINLEKKNNETETKYCVVCGEKLSSLDVFCPKCGNKVK